MRTSLLTTAGLAAAGLAVIAGLTGCGTSHPAAAAAASTASPSAAEAVLARNYFTSDQAVTFPPGMHGIASSALGFNGNAEQVAVVYDTAADAAAAVQWYQGQASSLGMDGVAVVQANGPVVTITGDDVHMAQYVQQITGYN